MPDTQTLALLLVLALILGAEFVNGWTDAPNAIATAVSTRVISPRNAVIMASILNILGALSGTAVATTIGKGIIDIEAVNLVTVGAAMIGIITWSTAAWYLGLPTSASHALVAGLTGAGLAVGGPDVLLWDGWRKVLIGLGFSTFLGFGGGVVLIAALVRIFQRHTPSAVRRIFGRSQVASAAFMAFSHGSNDAQKFMGVFALALVLGGVLPEFAVPLWVILLLGVTMGLGTAVGGWRIIKTMGLKVTHLETYQGFSAEFSAATTIELASRLGIPISTTHTISTAIMGVGASRRLSAVRWGVARRIVIAWILTFPACGAIAWLVASAATAVFK